MPEFILYGIPKGETERYTESILTVRHSRAEAESIIPRARADGWHGFRVAVFAGEAPRFGANLVSRRGR